MCQSFIILSASIKCITVLSPHSEVLECFKRTELLQWTSFQISYEEVLREGVPDCSATDVFATGTELGKEQWEDLRKRVIEHVSAYICFIVHKNLVRQSSFACAQTQYVE